MTQSTEKKVLEEIQDGTHCRNLQARNQAEARKPGLQHHKGLTNNKGAGQPAYACSLISAFVIRYLKNKVFRSDTS